MAKMLTSKAVENLLRKASKREEIPDGGCRGLYLEIFPTGRGSWLSRFRIKGKTARLTLGSVLVLDKSDTKPEIGGALTLLGARKLAIEALHKVQQGIDPRDEKKTDKAERERAASNTFQAVAEAY